MANDIAKIISSENIKNGTGVSCYSKTNFIKTNNYISNKPTIEDIQNKYDTRFDDVGYYFLGNNTIIGA